MFEPGKLKRRVLNWPAAKVAVWAVLGASAWGCSGTAGPTGGQGAMGASASSGGIGQPVPGASSSPPGAAGSTTPVVGEPAAPGASSTFGGTAPNATVEPVVEARVPLASRISKVEYAWSVLDVFGVQVNDSELALDNGGLPDDAGDGVFKRFADKQTTVEQHASGFLGLAQLVAERAAIEPLREAHGGCDEATLACVRPVLAGVGERLFRRPLDERELANYETVIDAAVEAGEDSDAVVRWILIALLQSPAFVFHLTNETNGQVGTTGTLDDFEMGARLAAFIWSSVPDRALLDAAAAGGLSQPAGLKAQVERMLADPKARRLTENFIRDYSRAERASFLGATDEDRNALRESIVATFQNLAWDDKQPLHALFTTTKFLVNPRTAELLGLEAVAAGLSEVDVSSLPERVGLLTHPGVLGGMGDQETGSFVNRGKFLMERLMCQHPLAVPAGLASALEEFNADTTGLSEHERMEIRKTRPECWGCHTQFEPLAFGFARFDGAGRYLGEMDAAGKPLPLNGWVPTGTEDSSPHYTNVREYMEILSTDPLIQECMTQHFLSYATRFAPDALTKAAAPAVGAEYVLDGQTLGSMVGAVSQSDLFRQFLVQSPTTQTGEN